MRYLHTMLRVRNLDRALDFYCNALGLKEVDRHEDQKGRYTLVFLAAPEDAELVSGVAINRPPRDGMMAFVRSPDRHSVELLQKGKAQTPREPWLSMPNTGHW